MRPINKKCVILSAELDFRDDQINKNNTDLLETHINRLNLLYKPLIGHYKGKNEAAFLVEYDHLYQRQELETLGQYFDQECILLLDEDRQAVLYNESDNGLTQVPLGKLQAISPKQAQKLDAWSYCPQLDQYYGVL